MLYRPPTTPTATAARHVTGQFLARNKLPARKRAQLAAALCSGETTVTRFTTKQAARLCRCCTPYVTAARGRSPAAKRLLREWNAADHDARVAFVRAARAESVFDVVTEAIG